MTVVMLYDGTINASGAIIAAIGTVSAANLIVLPRANGLEVGIYEVNP